MFKPKLRVLNQFLIIVAFAPLILSADAFSQSETEKQAKEIYNKYQTALGGKEQLDKIKTIETISEVYSLGGKITRKTVIEDKINNKKYIAYEDPNNGSSEFGFDGSRNWERSERFSGYNDYFSEDNINPQNLRKLPNETIKGKEYLVLQTKTENMTVTSFFDRQTHLLVRMESQAESSEMSLFRKVEFADYRKVGDVLVPFLQLFGSDSYERVLSVKHNIEVDPKIFELSDSGKKSDKKDEKFAKTTANQTLTIRSTMVFKDEKGNILSYSKFLQRRDSGNYLMRPVFSNGKIIGMRLVKRNN